MRIVVPIAPGGGTDILVRLLAPKASSVLGGSIVIDNRSGADGVIGTEHVVRSPPDGYTFLFSDSSVYINKIVRAQMPYDPMTDLIPVMRTAIGSLVLFANPRLDVRGMQDLLAKARQSPGAISCSTGSTGAALLTELLKIRTGVDIVHVPYRGGGPAMNDAISGHVQLTFNGASNGRPFIRSGELIGLGSTGTARNPSMPEVQTFEEQGLPGFPAASEWGLFAPLGVPQPIIDRVYAAFREALFDPAIAGRLAELGFRPDGAGTATYQADKTVEMQLWAEVATAARLTQQ
ncbi:tripartite tricarboxylate transporter substrate binding protein [Roseomonas sp. HJA6]|uniref:Tripartite tricarboxylate transporter substrate binding protein n=1 Tax=Roseomonas alba TaxID=2846776 RepID=A0ABS7AE48_9PROT|nr:tripartite tricarboxylate transporter substrate binding protein [Neoroseomonas alba]